MEDSNTSPLSNKTALLQQRFKALYSQSEISQYIIHTIISAVLGIAAGLGALLFHYLLEQMRHFFSPENILSLLPVDKYFIVLIPTAGGAVCALMTKLFSSTAREKGVLSVIKAIILNNGIIKLRVTIFHLVAPIVAIGSGAPLGPEGPVAKIGSGIGSFLSQTMKFNRDDMMMYASAGAGAAISAVFNAPIAGVFFGIEVILLNDLKNRALSALIISSVVADILSRSVLGNKHIFSIPEYTMGGIETFPFFLLLGILAGIVSITYFLMDAGIHNLIENRLKIRNHFLRLLPVAFVFGLVLVNYNDLYGIGYAAINRALSGNMPLNIIAALLFFKIVFLSLFLRAGSYGGKFAPSLSIGAFLGYLFAGLMNSIFGLSLDPVVFSLVGMGGVLAGINSAPLTAIMIVFEVTNDYTFILPLMLGSVVSYLVTVSYNRGTVYSRELLEEGIDVSKKNEIDLLGKIQVNKLMRTDFDMVTDRMPFRKLLSIMMDSRYGEVLVMDDREHLVGAISLRDIRQAIINNDLIDLLIARDLVQEVSAVMEHDPVSKAIQKIEQSDSEIIPVMQHNSPDRVAGILSHSDITNAYRTMLRGWKTNQFLIDYSQRSRRGPGTSQ